MSSPQDAKLVEVALREVEDALVRLARLGHLFHLAEGEGDEPEEWPKVVWHADGRSWEAYDPGHLAELGEGWHETLAEAKQVARDIRPPWQIAERTARIVAFKNGEETAQEAVRSMLRASVEALPGTDWFRMAADIVQS